MRASHPIGFFIFGFLFFIFLTGCGANETSRDDIPPTAPHLVERSPENLYAQRGIRPEPTATDNQYRVRIEWYPNTEPDVAGYRVWRRREDAQYFHWQIIRDLRYGTNLDRGPVLVFLDAGDDYLGHPSDLLRPDQPNDSISTRGFKWWIQAYDEAGNHSSLSDSLYFRMVNNPRNLRVERQAPARYVLRWQFTVNDDPDDLSYYYVLRIYQEAGGPDSVMWWQQVNRYADDTSVILNNDGSARPFVVDDTYVWQLNVVVMATDTSSRVPAGSAAYTTFVYQN
jgi:hypothetical protein